MTGGVQNFRASAGTVFGEFFQSFTDGFANSIGRAIVQAEDLGEALRGVAEQALSQLIGGLIKLGIQYVLNAALGKTLSAAATASSVAQAGVASAAWAPAAALASLATGGTNAAGANAAIASTLASTKALTAVGSFKDGGIINAPGGPRDDQGLAAVSNGEFIMNAKDTARNRPLLEAMNRGVDIMSRLPRFQLGGEFMGDITRKPQIIAQRAKNDIQATERSTPQPSRAEREEVNVVVRNVNVTDPAAAIQALQSDDGERSVLNIIEQNPEAVKAILR